jgi:hypothetical protein
MKLLNTIAPESCFFELSNWFKQRLTTSEYPEGWELENTFANCLTMPVYRFPIHQLSASSFPIDAVEQTGWNFIHNDLNGNEACFLVTQTPGPTGTQYAFNQANYGRRSADIKRIVKEILSPGFQAKYNLEFQASLLAGGPKYFYDVWLRSAVDSNINIFIDLPPNIYKIEEEDGISISVKDFGGYHGKLKDRLANDLQRTENFMDNEETLKSGIKF